MIRTVNLRVHNLASLFKSYIIIVTCMILTLAILITSISYIASKPIAQSANKGIYLKLNFDKMEKEISALHPKKDNLNKAYEYSGKAINITRELEKQIMNQQNITSEMKDAAVSAINFWNEIDRTIGDVDGQADELENLIREYK